MENILVQITSGRGPLECCRVVAKVQEMICREAKSSEIAVEVLSQEKTGTKGTFYSSVLLLSGKGAMQFAESWNGVIQWVAQSPYRTMHKRKNWFIAVNIYDVQKTLHWDEKDIRFETCRASGPGGQHVNKTESAVRAIHVPTQIQVLVMDGRSQVMNKKLSIERLKSKVVQQQTEQLLQSQQNQWQAHNELERGNPKRIVKQQLI